MGNRDFVIRIPIPGKETSYKKKNSQDDGFSMDLSKIVDDEGASKHFSPEPIEEKRHRGRPKKSDIQTGSVTKTQKKEQTPLNSNISYTSTYNVTNMLLGNSIQQIDDLSSKIKEDLDMIRTKSYKQKYDHICQLSGSMTGLMGDKIMAIREMNNTITTCHKLELGKMKELKLNESEDDDKRLMDLYNAYINAPVGSLAMSPFNGINNKIINNPQPNGIPIDSAMHKVNEDVGYQQYLQNLSPEQHAMIYEDNPNVETVLVYNQETHEKYFEVIDSTTGEYIPNMSLPPAFVVDECTVDIRNGVARDIRLNKEWRLKLIGNRVINEY